MKTNSTVLGICLTVVWITAIIEPALAMRSSSFLANVWGFFFSLFITGTFAKTMHYIDELEKRCDRYEYEKHM